METMPAPERAGSPADAPSRVLARIAAWRAPILVLYAVLVPLAAFRAARIPAEGGIDRLVRPDDPDYLATRAFQRIFPDTPSVLLLFESEDPFAPASLARVDAATREVRTVPHVSAFSAVDAIRRAHPGATPEAINRLATGTSFFSKQGLVGPTFLAVVGDLDVHSGAERDAALAGIDAGLERAKAGPVRRIGAPYVESWIEKQSGSASARYFPFFGALVVAAALFLYRSLRTLFAFLLSLAAAVALAVAAGGILGFTFTIISVLVPLTVLVTTLATLVYLHSRFVDRPPGVPVPEHQIAALRNKLLPVTVSNAAAVLGFAALAVSALRPIRELGIWTAVGLVLSWMVAFTLFPALQIALRTPTRAAAVPGQGTLLARVLPPFTRRHRVALVGAAVAVCAAGAVALFGIPARLAPMSASVDTLTYIDPSLPIRQDLEWFRQHVGDLNLAHVWIHLQRPEATSPDTLRAIDDFQRRIESLPSVLETIGPTTFLRLRSYFAGRGEDLPRDPAQFARVAADFEQLLLSEPALRGYVDPNGLSDVNVTVLFRKGDAKGYAALARAISSEAGGIPQAQVRVVGQALVEVKIGASLVPTLSESFAITAALIFVVFLFVFRSASARLLAMIPSFFAILATFLGMRLLGVSLNLATILVATTVLGTTETDQVHFFHHLHERDGAPLGEALSHALRVSGGAILYATIINAAGFLALAFSSFPPLRQFGIVTSSAFVLALVADFTALPAGLWLTRRGRLGAKV